VLRSGAERALEPAPHQGGPIADFPYTTVPGKIKQLLAKIREVALLGEAIRQGYADLFAVYPDANQRTQSDLDHVFSTSSTSA
jgi:hypothetical protein